MAVTFGVSGTAGNGTTTAAPTYPASTQAGDYLLAIVGSGNSANDIPTAPDGTWTLLGSAANTDGTWGNQTGPRRATLYGKIAAGGESGSAGNFAIAAGVSNSLIVARIERYDKSTANPWVVSIYTDTYAIAEGTALHFDFNNVVLATGDALYLASGGPNASQRLSGQAFSAAGITFTAVTERVDSGQTNGNDMTIHAASCEVTAGSGTVDVDFDLTQDVSEGGVLAVLSDAPAGAVTVDINPLAEVETLPPLAPVATLLAPINVLGEVETLHPLTATPGAVTKPIGVLQELETLPVLLASPGAVTEPIGVLGEEETLRALSPEATVTVSVAPLSEAEALSSLTPSPGPATQDIGVMQEVEDLHSLAPSPGNATTSLNLLQELELMNALVPVSGITVPIGKFVEIDVLLPLVPSATVTTALGALGEIETMPALTPVAGGVTRNLDLLQEIETILPLTPTSGVIVPINALREVEELLSLTPTAGNVLTALGLLQEIETLPGLTAEPGGVVSAVDPLQETELLLPLSPVAGNLIGPVATLVEHERLPALTASSFITVAIGPLEESESLLALTPIPGNRLRPIEVLVEVEDLSPLTFIAGPVTEFIDVLLEVETLVSLRDRTSRTFPIAIRIRDPQAGLKTIISGSPKVLQVFGNTKATVFVLPDMNKIVQFRGRRK